MPLTRSGIFTSRNFLNESRMSGTFLFYFHDQELGCAPKFFGIFDI